MPVLRHLSRAARVSAVCVAAFALAVPPANAVVTPGSSAGVQTYLTSDGAGDAMSMSCNGGHVYWVEGPLDYGINCSADQLISIDGNGGTDTIDLSAVVPADFTSLPSVLIDPGPGADNVKGSYLADVITGDAEDTIQGLGGNDRIKSGDSVFGGDGNDTLDGTDGLADGGPGNDSIKSPSSGPLVGGPGDDRVVIDYSATTSNVPFDLNFAVSDAVLHLEIAGAPIFVDVPSTEIELYDIRLLDDHVQTWNSSAYSGWVDIAGVGGVDRLTAGPGEDILDGGEGNDELTGGAGFDLLRGGTGDDVVSSRDGEPDRVNCGDGNDTVTADYADVLAGCEKVLLPPPVTGAVKGPKTVKQGVKARFTFTSSTPGATFQCRLDKKPWKACKSPYSVATKNLKASAAGVKHVLRVRAVAGGGVDATPSKKAFKVVKP